MKTSDGILEMGPKGGKAVLGAAAGDEVVTTGMVKSQAGVVETRSPALAPKHSGRVRSEH